MKIWLDILAPKEITFSEPIIERLGKKHEIFCTARRYGEVTRMAKIRNFKVKIVGKHGGKSKSGKLDASISRMAKLSKIIQKFSPDLVMSYNSPEAARIAYGLGIKHISFCDFAHAKAQNSLTVPFLYKLFVPDPIKKEILKYGIKPSNVISYNAHDAAVTIKRSVPKTSIPVLSKTRKNIIVRTEEEEAAYIQCKFNTAEIIQKLVSEFDDCNIVVLGRYPNQIARLKKLVGNKAKVIRMTYDGVHILKNTDVFIGSGGTMTAESALMGIPTISYAEYKYTVETYLVVKKLVKRETDPTKICRYIRKIFANPEDYKKRARDLINTMDDPIDMLVELVDKIERESKSNDKS